MDLWSAFSDYGILVVRHDPNLEKHKGMTFFFLDMKSPGIEVKPIKQITGGSSFNEVYFCLLYTSPSPRDYAASRMPSSA